MKSSLIPAPYRFMEKQKQIQTMIYREYPPSEKLQGIVLNYWSFEIDEKAQPSSPIQHITLPDNSVSVVLISQPYFQGVRMLGQHTHQFEQSIFPNSIYLGIRLLPWLNFTPALFERKKILNATAAALPLIETYFNDMASGLKEVDVHLIQKLESTFLQLINTCTIVQNDMIKYICLALDEGVPIATIVDEVPFSVRVIQKKFKAHVGLTMRQYANTSRQRRLWTERLYEGKDIKELIYDYNFYDQAHFINHFKKIMKVPHSVFEAYYQQIEHSMD